MVANVAYLSDRLTADHKVSETRAQSLLDTDPAWASWFQSAGVATTDAFVYLEIDDTTKPRRRVSGGALAFRVEGMLTVLAAQYEIDAVENRRIAAALDGDDGGL